MLSPEESRRVITSDIKVTVNPIEQCFRYALPSESAWVLYIAEGEDLQELKLQLRCKGEKTDLEAMYN